MANFDLVNNKLAVALIPTADSTRIDAHAARLGRSRQDVVSELLRRALNNPELVRREEAAKGGVPDGYFDVGLRTVARADSEREDSALVFRIVRGDHAGRCLVARLWYPPAGSLRRGPHQHFNAAVGLPPQARLFGREPEVEGTHLLLKYWREATPEGVEERFHFIPRTAEKAA